MKIFKPRFWNKKNNLISYALFPFSFFLQIFLIIKKKISKKKKCSIPVICVGNIYLGGTGKTPLSIEIIEIFMIYVSKLIIKGVGLYTYKK